MDNGLIYQLSSDGLEYELISFAEVDEIVDPTILSEINGIPVTSVRLNATLGFQNVKGTLTIPASIKELGSSVFSGKYIDTIVFEEGSPIKTIHESTFSGCQFLESITFPDGLETIEMYAFNGCDLALEYVDIPASVKEIEAQAFANCTSLKAVQINGDENMIIREPAFAGCWNGEGEGPKLYFPNIKKKPADWPYFDGIQKSYYGKSAPIPEQ